MAVINFFNDVFGSVSRTEYINEKTTLKKIANQYIASIDNEEVMEIYNIKTGETEYKVTTIENYKVVCLVNGVEQPLDYEVKENDVVDIVYIPQQLNEGAAEWVTGGGGFLASVGYIVLLASSWTGVGAIVGGVLCGIGTGLAIWGTASMVQNMKDSLSSSSGKNKDQLDSESQLSIRGGSNSSIVGNKYPLILGKHLVTPYLAGNYYNETFTDDLNSKISTQYLHALYCVGYAPLKITDIKLGETILAYNRTSNSGTRDTIFHGLLNGSKIENKWKNNDVEIEILQKGTLHAENDKDKYGNIYNQVCIQDEVNANLLFTYDKDIENQAALSYAGIAIPAGYQTNTIRLSAFCPQKIEVDIDFPSGIYCVRTEKDGSNSYPTYRKLNIAFVIQWRYRNSEQSTTDAQTPDGWNDFDYIKLNNGNQKAEPYTSDIRSSEKQGNHGLSDDTSEEYNNNWLDKNAFHFGGQENHLSADVSITPSTTFTSYVIYYQNNQVTGSAARYCFILCKTEEDIEKAKTDYPEPSNYTYQYGTELPELTENFLTKTVGVSMDSYTSLSDFKWHSIGTLSSKKQTPSYYRTDDFNVNERRYTVVKEFTPQECFNMLDKDTGLSTSAYIEVRVVRLTPCFIDQTGTSSDKYGDFSYQDVSKWTYMRTYTFDKDKFLTAWNNNKIEDKSSTTEMLNYKERNMSEADLDKFCFISFKIKQDQAETSGESLDQFNVIASTLGPKYNADENKWYPEKIENYNTYKLTYKGSRKKIVSGNVQYVALTKTVFFDSEEKFEEFYNGTYQTECSQIGVTPLTLDQLYFQASKINNKTDFVWSIKKDIYSDGYTEVSNDLSKTIITSAMLDRYETNNSAAMAMLSLIGPHLGKDAKIYSALDIPSFSEAYKFCEDVTDGSVVSKGSSELAHIKFCANAVISQEIKLETLFSQILATGRCIYRLNSENKYEVVIDKPKNYPVMVLNEQNVLKKSNVRSFDTPISGYLLTYTDEEDGYSENEMYIMADEEDYTNPNNEIESLSIPYVTNREQAYSLGRYMLAAKLYQRESYSRTIGMSGLAVSIGDLVLIQDNSLLVGNDNGGRITDIIYNSDKSLILGFISSEPFNCKADGTEGVTIVQPSKYMDSRCVTLQLAKGGSGETVQAFAGLTNKVVLMYPINVSNGTTASDSSVIVKPEIGNLLAFGTYTKITEKALVASIKPEKNNQFTLSLIPYNDLIYNSGKEIPEFQSKMSIPEREATEYDLSGNIKIDRVFEMANSVSTVVSNTIIESLPELIQKLEPSPIVQADISAIGFAVDRSDCAMADQQKTVTFDVVQNVTHLDFKFGKIIYPEEWIVTTNEKKVTITIPKGTKLTTEYITIPVIYKPFVQNYWYTYDLNGSKIYVTDDINILGDFKTVSEIPSTAKEKDVFNFIGPETVDSSSYTGVFKTNVAYQLNSLGKWEEFNPQEYAYGDIVYGEETTKNMVITCEQVKGGAYLNGISSTDNIPTGPVLGDFFCWTGENTDSSLCAEGTFKQTAVYVWNGTQWAKTNDYDLNSTAMTDVLSVGASVLKENNSVISEKFDRIVSNTAIIEKLIASSAFIEALNAMHITLGYDETKQQGGVIKSSNFVSGSKGWQIDYNGNAEFSSVTMHGTVNNSDVKKGTIQEAEITKLTTGSSSSDKTVAISGGGWTDSTSTQGFGILRNGDAYFNNGDFRGTFNELNISGSGYTGLKLEYDVRGDTYGDNNTIIGYENLPQMGTDTYGRLPADNIVIGFRNLSQSKLSDNNVVIGNNNNQEKGDCSNSVCIGNSINASNGLNSVVIGNEALSGNKSEYITGGVIIGAKAGQNATSGYSDIYIGQSAGANSEGKQNVVIGSSADSISGDLNVCIGNQAKINKAGIDYGSNIAIGTNSSVTGANSVAIGAYANTSKNKEISINNILRVITFNSGTTYADVYDYFIKYFKKDESSRQQSVTESTVMGYYGAYCVNYIKNDYDDNIDFYGVGGSNVLSTVQNSTTTLKYTLRIAFVVYL